MYQCHASMESKAYKPEDIFPFSRVVVSGIGAMVDFEIIRLHGNNPLNVKHLQRGNTIRKEGGSDVVVNPTRVTS